jgi:hypothetical protein
LLIASWIAYLVAGLSIPLGFLASMPTQVGTSYLQILGWGAVLGTGLGAAAYLVFRPVFGPRRWIRKFKPIVGCISLGALRGLGGAGLMDRSQATDAYAVELPIVRVEERPARRSRARTHVVTIEPSNPTYQKRVFASDVRGDVVRQGDCLLANVKRGRLGGFWVPFFKAEPCSQRRGTPASHVMITGSGFDTWRWHAPIGYRYTTEGQALDEALPSQLICRTEEGAWLYRCMKRH